MNEKETTSGPDIDNELLERYFKGKAHRRLKARIVAWATASEANEQRFMEAKTNQSLRHFANESADASDFQRFSNYIEQHSNPQRQPVLRRESVLRWGFRVAAALALPVALTFAIQNMRLSSRIKEHEKGLHIAQLRPEQTQTLLNYIVNPGVKGKVLLPDSSEVWLNSHSILHCPNQFDSKNRIVALEGEGYFKIKGDQDWPFFINTQKGVSVKVTGTEFNLSSYSNDPYLKITLIKGEVMVIDDISLKTIVLQPMEEVVLTNNTFTQAEKNVANKVAEDTSWKEGFLFFDNTPMDAVIRKMERWYGVAFTITDPRILQFRITAEFESESLVQVLEIFKISSNVHYLVDGTNVSLHL